MTGLWVYKNKLTGEIPLNICNLTNLQYLNVKDNQFCLPYPDCVSDDYIDSQDTSNCP